MKDIRDTPIDDKAINLVVGAIFLISFLISSILSIVVNDET